jgi:alkylation response protein AidB-like acyl-CoA dehydrogenase
MGRTSAKTEWTSVMQFEFSEQDVAFRKSARQWLRDNAPPEAPPHSGRAARDFAVTWLRKRHAGGWSGISWPSEYGGRGLSFEKQIIWHEEYVRSGAPTPLDPTFVALNHAGPTLMECGTEEQRAFHLPLILSGNSIWCQGFSEPGAGSDLAGIRTTGRIDGDHLVVTGQKIWTSFADIADYQELLVRTEPGSHRHKGLSWVICDMTLPGITIRPIKNLAGATHFAEVFYDDVRIPLSNVVGPLHGGWGVAMTTLGFERRTAAITLQLMMEQKIEALASLFLRSEGDVSRSSIGQNIALARAEAAALRALTYRTLFKDPATPFDGSIVRLFFAELCQKIYAIGMEILGPRNAEAQQDQEWVHHYLEAFSETIAGGTAEIQRNIIGERILNLPRGGAK